MSEFTHVDGDRVAMVDVGDKPAVDRRAVAAGGLAHQLPIDGVDVTFDVGEDAVEAVVTVSSTGQTGVEMEALNGVTRALVTVFDMVKSAENTEFLQVISPWERQHLLLNV